MLLKNKLYLTTLFVSGMLASTLRPASAIETSAKNVLVMDYETGQYLYAKDHQKMIPPASMSKLMTIYMILKNSKTARSPWTIPLQSAKMPGARAGLPAAVQLCF